jgi:hypothetical protein
MRGLPHIGRIIGSWLFDVVLRLGVGLGELGKWNMGMR